VAILAACNSLSICARTCSDDSICSCKQRQGLLAGRQLRDQIVAPHFQAFQLLLDAPASWSRTHARSGAIPPGWQDRAPAAVPPARRRGLPLVRRAALAFSSRVSRRWGSRALKRLDGDFHAAAGGAQILFGAFQFGAHIGQSRLELAQPPRSIRRARLRRVEGRAPIDMLAMQPVDLGLKAIALVLVLAHALAHELQSLLRLA
jgi:hypothetical protein